jgi:hypothetical protein
MTTYTAHFYTEADWAETTIVAETPELALQRAREIESDETETLAFRSYDTTSGVDLVPDLLTDSYKIAAICERAIAKAKGGAA